MSRCRVTFLPDNRTLEVEEGLDLLRVAAMAGIELKSSCGGEGTCGRCAVAIKEGRALVGQGNLSRKNREAGYVLACRTLVQGDLVVEIPAASRMAEHQVLLEKIEKKEILAEVEKDPLEKYGLEPFSRKLTVELTEPTIYENASDLSRLVLGLQALTGTEGITISLAAARTLPEVLRQGNWQVTVTMVEQDGRGEIIQVEPGRATKPSYGLAIDIGTTTVVVLLVDTSTGLTIDRAGTHNKQFRFGDDVITRIIYATEESGGQQELQRAVLDTINELVDRLLVKNGLTPGDVHSVVTAGNTTMAHLFLGIWPGYIRLEPYIPAAAVFPVVRGKDLGLHVHPEALVLTYPAVASYVGGDIVSGALVVDIANSEELTLFIDIGTNGEMVLGNKDLLVSAACSAGPAFEGGGISCGMRATPGAIQRLEIDPRLEVKLDTIGGEKPMGICGTGLVDSLAKLREAGVIDRTGKFQPGLDGARRREGNDGPEFVLSWSQESGIGKDVVITEADVKNVIRAKGAIFAGIRSLLQTVEMPVEAIERIYIAGGFGNFLNLRDTVEIGMLPDVPAERYSFVGNTSVKGARVALLSQRAFREALELARKMTYLELSLGTTFMDEFTLALFLPHTDLELFPSVQK
ncbi:MAG: ASKHA domain-containing protein [Firmicutes bacterium]|nr:ASKHA domain-containing protein [Bacillota bacterium]MCL5039471.1 ASKHA domain-containing protein [Bacillota bacterium]